MNTATHATLKDGKEVKVKKILPNGRTLVEETIGVGKSLVYFVGGGDIVNAEDKS